jgi:inositol phosphorylceramide synthase catalytic subunit
MKVLSLRERIEQLRRAPRFHSVGVPALAAAYLIIVHAVGGVGLEHVAAAGAFVGLALWSNASRKLARVLMPFLLYAVVYDSMRWYEDYIRSPVIHLREPYDFDLKLFGIPTASGTLTPNEWFQLHTSPVLDFICGLSYTPFFFIGESLLLALYLLYAGQEKRAVRFMWIFVASNFVGFSMYYIYPAAPPWYVADHGFVADLSVPASSAGAARFDELLGVPLMAMFYSKSADVFGAIPSLHVVYPLLALLYGWRLPRFRIFAGIYLVLVCLSAVYLNHHYIIDLLIGFALALVVMAAFRLAGGPLEQRAADLQVEPNRVPV